jgi:hypothetical protein
MAILISIGSILQLAGIIRGLLNSPIDWLGIGLYCVIAIMLALASWGLFTQWKREKRKENFIE